MKGNFDKVTTSEIPVLVDFFAVWCGPCKTLAPILKEVKDELGDAVRIVKIDVDKNRPLASRYEVRGVPTMVLFKNGKQLWRKSGVLPKHEIMGAIKANSQSYTGDPRLPDREDLGKDFGMFGSPYAMCKKNAFSGTYTGFDRRNGLMPTCLATLSIGLTAGNHVTEKVSSEVGLIPQGLTRLQAGSPMLASIAFIQH